MSKPRTVLFVCLHGAAKSVLAAGDFTRLAAARGLDVRADFAGLEPDPEIAPAVREALRRDGVDFGDRRPRRVSREDVGGAWRVVTFGCDLGPSAAPAPRVERWDDVPAVRDGLPAARAAIRAHLERLLEACARP